jgi:hypothetical protein
MSWHRESDAERQYGCVLVERLTRDDDGLIIGSIMQFHIGGPAYAHIIRSGYYERIGACMDVDAARRAVEQRLEQQ